MQKTKYCGDCADAKEVCTGSTIFYLCPVNGAYRSVNDSCIWIDEMRKGNVRGSKKLNSTSH